VQAGIDTEGQRFVLAEVTLPACVGETGDQYVLHPSVLDSALQASIGLSLDHHSPLSERVIKAELPFALDQLQILDRSPTVAVVVVRQSKTFSTTPSTGSIQKRDIDICDESGRVSVRLRGVTSRMLETELSQPRSAIQEDGTLLLTPYWAAAPLLTSALDLPGEYGARWVLIDPIYKQRIPELKVQSSAMQWAVLPGQGNGSAAEQLIVTGKQVFARVQSILQSKPKQAVLLQVLLGGDETGRTEVTSALSGLLKSAHQENPNFIGQVITISHTATVAELARAVDENASAAAKRDAEIRYVDGVRETRRFQELSKPVTAASSLPWKDGGVYLITGGGGGLGLIVAREIVNRVNAAKIILTGRSAISAATQAAIDALKNPSNETHIEYRVLDVTNVKAVTRCVHSLVEHYGALNGIVHSAGIAKDNFIIKKTAKEFTTVLGPKVSGTANLGQATQDVALDFLILFSSMAGAFGNVGQSDYALANAFMDGYAAYRNQLAQKNERHGKALSINWPLWESGGMSIDIATVERMRRQGLEPLTTTAGIDALYRAWQSEASQVVVLAGNRQQLEILFGAEAQSVSAGSTESGATSPDRTQFGAGVSKGELQEKTLQYLKKLLSGALKLPAERIEADVGLEKYGIDSILALKLVNELEASFGSLSKTLLFEYQSIEALAEYFIENHGDVLSAYLKLAERVDNKPFTAISAVQKVTVPVALTNGSRSRFSRRPSLDQYSAQARATDNDDIAIIGISGRYPGANNLEEYWENLKAGKDCITEIPKTRWDHRQYFDTEKGKFGKSYSKWGGFIDGVDQFDPMFFNIAPREAQFMDPQERLFLQCAFGTIEDAGYTREVLGHKHAHDGMSGNVGVFVGVMYGEYQLYAAEARSGVNGFALSNSFSYVANRVSYCCNFHGPSLAVDTMCSSSLTAIHLACQSIKTGGCEVAIAGGVNVTIHPNKYFLLSQGQFAASNGRCMSFGVGGDGYVPGEGVGAVLLKPLSQAIVDQDHIYGVIKGTSINHGGKTNGYTVPNLVAQAQVIAQALKASKINPRTISYVEAHGTGTSLGDPIEIAGLGKAFSAYTQDTQFCAIGSAKSNIGHLESAAGIAGVTKVLLQLKHQTLVPSLHSEVLNPHIDFAHAPFVVQRELGEWRRPIIALNGQTKEYPRIAGISSFGAGGSNAHVIIEEYRTPAVLAFNAITSDRPALIPLSAKNEERLKEQVAQLLSHLERCNYADSELVNIAYTLQVGREAMERRLALSAVSIDELKLKLGGYLTGELEDGGVERCYQGDWKKNREALSTIDVDEDMSQTLNTWLEKGKHAKLLELWAKGLSFDWTTMYGDGSAYGGPIPQRISLPTYPFSKERHWIGTGDKSAVAESRANEVLRRTEIVETTETTSAPRQIGLRQLASFAQVGAPAEETKGPMDDASVRGVDVLTNPVVSRKESWPDTHVSAVSRTGLDLDFDLESELSLSLASALFMDVTEIDREKPFLEMGMDSIVGVEWMKTLNTRYGLSLVATKLYDYPTIKTLTGFIARDMRADGDFRGIPVDALTSGMVSAVVDASLPTRAVLTPLSAENLQVQNASALEQGRVLRLTDTTTVQVVQGSIDLAATSLGAQEVLPIEQRASKPHLLHSRESIEPARTEAIAIIGMSGRYPGASNLNEYWENLAAGRNEIEEIPSSRWAVNDYYDAQPGKPGKIYCKWLGRLDDVDCFDALFFNISPAEAQTMDPQQRLFLQEGYRAFQDAGYSARQLNNRKCGVYLGIMGNEYSTLLYQTGQNVDSATGNNSAIAAARIAYYLNLKGPAIPIDTACSSSLVATHLACQALRTNEIEMALVGGVTLYLTAQSYIGMCAAGMLSPDGQCKTFDNGANGFVPGEGVGALVLRRLSDAAADGDRIYGVVIGSGINQDGKTNGITAPSSTSQIELMRDVYERYQIDSESISYVETHGTGTKLGDPIELGALSDVFKGKTSRRHYCAIGSVKSNIGHTSAAAGVAGVHKVLLAIQHRELVPTLNFVTPNEHFDFENSPFVVNTERRTWETQEGRPRLAAVSSFGFSGTNAHVVIEEYCAPLSSESSGNVIDPVLILLSAKTEDRLNEQISQLRAHIESSGYVDADLARVAYTLQVGRDAMEYRLAFIARTQEQAVKMLSDCGSAERSGDLFRGKAKKTKENVAILDGDDDANVLVATWIRKKKLKKLAQAWVAGLDVEWRTLYLNNKTRSLRLPGYPFARERHWIESAAARIATTPNEHGVRSERLLSKMWQASPVASQASALPSVAIVCTSETQGLADQLAQRFAKSRVLIVDGDSAELPEVDWQTYAGWIDVAGCGVGREHAVTWITCLQQWIERGPREGLLALCVTRGLEAHENADSNLTGADRVGLYRMLSSEHSRITSRHVDVDPVVDEQAVIAQILAECSGPRDEIEVCYRHGTRYGAALQDIAPNYGVVAVQEHPLPSFPREQVLWITGGTRGIGYACAQHFVRQHGVKRLVLTGRDEFPPRAQWHQAQLEQTSIAEKICAVLALEAEGAEIQVLSVSLTDAEALQKSVHTIKTLWGSIGGVIHCAGMTDVENPAFIRKSVASIQAVLAPKVSGLDNLVSCFAKEPLRFFLLFSSVSATVPSLAVGNSDYAMANAYMDYVAQAYATTLPIQSIQWPNWKETGMGEVSTPLYRQLGFLSHTTAEGLRFLDHLLVHKTGAVVLPAMADAARWQPARLMRYNAREVAPSNPVAICSKTNSAGVAGASLSAVQSWLVSLVARTLKIEVSQIEIDTALPDYGVDSIMLVQLLRPISERVGEPIDPSILFEYPTIEGLSQWLISVHGSKLQAELMANPVSVNAAAQSLDGSAIAIDSTALAPNPVHLANIVHRPQPLMQYSNVGAVDIAVVGLACRFPDASSIEKYWRLLSEGRSAIRGVPQARWGHASNYYAGVLDNATQFDAAFFLISPADAQAMDPQALLVLEESLMLWYQAGYSLDEIKGHSIGVYLGARSQHSPDTASLHAASNPIMAVGANYLAANISRFFDLRGPSVVIDTACSSALVAMNMAMQSIRSGEIESALVGGVSLLTNDGALRMFEQRGILNRDGAFHLFDRRANGAILGEGAGLVWLKTVDQALRDGDSIYAVIKALAINNDGRTAGPAAPNLQALKEVMQSALARSGKQAEEIAYIEVNGSGTEITDLLELKAIEAVYRASSKTVCELGSMKPNIGHPLCAEGIASFIKSVLMLHHGQRVPFLSAQEPMRHYDLGASPFRFTRSDNHAGPAPTTVAINCFADGGTNAHVILEAWRETEPRHVTHTSIAPPVLRKVECRLTKPASSRESNVLGKQRRRNDHVPVNEKTRTEDHSPDFWEKHVGLNPGNQAMMNAAEVAE